ncbi:hypothetical protein HC256_005588 [Beauveria bassiana]|nr:hypothetical protein HC256_005588 [Beauveria bassiana]
MAWFDLVSVVIMNSLFVKDTLFMQMLVKTFSVLYALYIAAQGAPKQFPLNKHPHSHVDQDPSTMRCGTGSNTQECPARFTCTAPPNCERYFQGVYYEGCIGTCVPQMPSI